MFLINRQFAGPGAAQSGDGPKTFPAPALEPAYDFTAKVFYRRIRTSRRASAWLDARERDGMTETVRELVREVSRRFSILEPGKAESAVNAELDRRLAAADPATRPAWSVRVEVVAPDEVRKMMREALQKSYEIDSRARESEQRLSWTNALYQRWAEFLDDATKNPTAPHALELAEAKEAARVLRETLGERKSDVGEWLDLVARIVEANRSAGVLDLVVESETVLRKTLELMGIELPALASDALLLHDGAGA